MLARWYWMAPWYLPSPIVIILKRPDSIEPLKSVWGLTRLTRPIQSACDAYVYEPHGEAERFTDLHDIHGRAHGTAHRGFGDAVVLEDRELALGRATTVAAHGWEDERAGAEVLEGPHGGADDDVDVGDAPAASTDRDGVTALDRQARGGQGIRHRAGDVGDAWPRKGLAHAHHSGE